MQLLGSTQHAHALQAQILEDLCADAIGANHGGAGAIGRFSAAHSITSGETWVAALILMALGEAVARTALLGLRAYALAPSQFFARTSMIGAGDRAR